MFGTLRRLSELPLETVEGLVDFRGLLLSLAKACGESKPTVSRDLCLSRKYNFVFAKSAVFRN